MLEDPIRQLRIPPDLIEALADLPGPYDTLRESLADLPEAVARRECEELALLEALPNDKSDLISYLRKNPYRCDAVAQIILNRCHELLGRLELTETCSEVPRLQGLLQVFMDIRSLKLETWSTLVDDGAYNEFLNHWLNELSIDEEFNAMRAQRKRRTGRAATYEENQALFYMSYLLVKDEGKFNELKRDTAINVVIWKMLTAWLNAITDDDPRVSETDLFGANQLQLLRGSSGKVLGRSAIEQRITQAATRYSDSPLNSSKTVHEQTIVEELFPNAPKPLFWFQDHSYGKHRKNRQSRKKSQPKDMETYKVVVWRCDSCTDFFPPEYFDATLIPWAFRSDTRIMSRRDVTLRDRLPTHAYPESRFMCTCWEQRAGVLYPVLEPSDVIHGRQNEPETAAFLYFVRYSSVVSTNINSAR